MYLLTNTLGERDSEYRYRAWGDRYVTPTGEAVQSPFGYKGREEDRETGLVYLRNRYYSPRLERFVNEDPIGISGGLNVYGFAGLDPANLADRMGLCPTCDTVHVVDKLPPSPAERELFGMWFNDYMNSLMNGYDTWDNPLWPRSSTPGKKAGGARFGPSTPRSNQKQAAKPSVTQCMGRAAASALTAVGGAAVAASGAAYRTLASDGRQASAVFASWGASVGAYMFRYQAGAWAATGAALTMTGGIVIGVGVGLLIGTAVACL